MQHRLEGKGVVPFGACDSNSRFQAAKSCGEFFSMVGYLACTFVPRVANWLGLSYISPGAREHIYGISKRELLQRHELSLN